MFVYVKKAVLFLSNRLGLKRLLHLVELDTLARRRNKFRIDPVKLRVKTPHPAYSEGQKPLRLEQKALQSRTSILLAARVIKYSQ